VVRLYLTNDGCWNNINLIEMQSAFVERRLTYARVSPKFILTRS